MHKCTHYDNDKAQDIRTVAKHQALEAIDGAIYWHIVEQFVTSDIDKLKLVIQFEKAFAEWQPYFLPIKFVSSKDASKAAIKIHFMYPEDELLPEPFGDTTLAYAYFPQGESLGIHADMYFNDKFNWSDKHSAAHHNLFKVIVHELGHAFGLYHSTDVRDIMYPTYQPDDSVVITKDTLQGIHYLYGEPALVPLTEIKAFIKHIFGKPHGFRRLHPEQIQILAHVLGTGYYPHALQETYREIARTIAKL
jgi:predicted Zn-dependent protease